VPIQKTFFLNNWQLKEIVTFLQKITWMNPNMGIQGWGSIEAFPTSFALKWIFLTDPESGNRSVCIEAKIEHFKFLPENDLSGGKFMRGIDCAHSRSLKTLSWSWFREWRWCVFSTYYVWLFFSVYDFMATQCWCLSKGFTTNLKLPLQGV
jgi:hypothetical protein